MPIISKLYEFALILHVREIRRPLNQCRQEPIKGSLHLSYSALESTLSRVDLFLERLPGEILHAHSST